MPFAIRAATPADIPLMHAIRCAVRENRLSDPSLVTEASYRRYVEAGSIWVAVDGAGTALGFAALDLAGGSVWALFVDPGREGSGVGRALHDFMIDRASEAGLARLWLTTATGTRAEQFYLAAGWCRAGAASAIEVRFERDTAAE